MNEQLLYTLLGAALAIGGGFLAEWSRSIHNQRQEDQRVLWEILTYLHDYGAVVNQLKKFEIGPTEIKLKLELEEVNFRDNMCKLSLKLKDKKYMPIGVHITKFCLDEQFRTKNNLYVLLREVQLNINDKLIKRYEKEIEENPKKL